MVLPRLVVIVVCTGMCLIVVVVRRMKYYYDYLIPAAAVVLTNLYPDQKEKVVHLLFGLLVHLAGRGCRCLTRYYCDDHHHGVGRSQVPWPLNFVILLLLLLGGAD